MAVSLLLVVSCVLFVVCLLLLAVGCCCLLLTDCAGTSLQVVVLCSVWLWLLDACYLMYVACCWLALPVVWCLLFATCRVLLVI